MELSGDKRGLRRAIGHIAWLPLATVQVEVAIAEAGIDARVLAASLADASDLLPSHLQTHLL